MNKREAKRLINQVAANWNTKNLTEAGEKTLLDTWMRYLANIDYIKASAVIDERAISGSYPPKPAEIFTAVLAADGIAPPSAAQGLVDAKKLIQAVQSGTKIPTVHPVVAETVADAGLQRDDVFQKIYEERRSKFLTKLLADPSSYLDGGNKKEGAEPKASN